MYTLVISKLLICVTGSLKHKSFKIVEKQTSLSHFRVFHKNCAVTKTSANIAGIMNAMYMLVISKLFIFVTSSLSHSPFKIVEKQTSLSQFKVPTNIVARLCCGPKKFYTPSSSLNVLCTLDNGKQSTVT
jgi:hypothetical protein